MSGLAHGGSVRRPNTLRENVSDGLMLHSSVCGQLGINSPSKNVTEKTHKYPFLHLLQPNVGQIWQWQSQEHVSSQIYPTWEREEYKWLSDCGEITPWKEDQRRTSFVFYGLTERIKKWSGMTLWAPSKPPRLLVKRLRPQPASLEARGGESGANTHRDTWLSYHKLKSSQMRITYYKATNAHWQSKALFGHKMAEADSNEVNAIIYSKVSCDFHWAELRLNSAHPNSIRGERETVNKPYDSTPGRASKPEDNRRVNYIL